MGEIIRDLIIATEERSDEGVLLVRIFKKRTKKMSTCWVPEILLLSSWKCLGGARWFGGLR